MKSKLKVLSASVALSAAALASQAAFAATPTFETGLNEMFFANFEVVLRTEESCRVLGGCLANGDSTTIPNFTATAPAGWQLANPLLANNIKVGDVFAGIFNVQNIDHADGSNSNTLNNFTGYFAQQVQTVYANGLDPFDVPDGSNSLAHLTLVDPTVDPFGILAAGEMFRFYVDPAGTWETNGGYADDIAKATNGTLWASFTGTGGYMYSHPDLNLTGANVSEQTAKLALNLVTKGGAWNAGSLALINDSNENELGGLATAPATGLCLPTSAAPILCTSLIGTTEIEANQQGVLLGGSSPWFFRSNDPAAIYVPEPGMLTLLGAGLVGLGAARRRRRESKA